MNELKIKRAYEACDEQDGYRILVDRLWPRGIKKENARLDLWAKEIAPTNELRKWFGHDLDKFEEFSKRYIAELEANPQKDEFLNLVKEKLQSGHVTLVYGAKDGGHNNAVILKKWILGQI
jgi:uncharacterized protein YeaO (DUF488 family)